jgi:hypothetical protein
MHIPLRAKAARGADAAFVFGAVIGNAYSPTQPLKAAGITPVYGGGGQLAGTQLTGINDSSQIVGYYTNTNNPNPNFWSQQGFVYSGSSRVVNV